MEKLNYKRTFYIGFAFFTIILLWQVYNYTVPLFLESMGINDTLKGFIMSLDNLLALFMLPLFGKISDITKSRIGRRMPYIIVGTVLASITFPFIAIFALDGELVGMIITIALVLIFMNIYRAPAVALMPDLTPKKHHAMANGIINLMGGIGGIFAYLSIQLFFKGDTKLIPFIVVSVSMLIALIILFIKVKERDLIPNLELKEASEEVKKETNKLDKDKVRSLLFILFAVFSWYFAVNAIETFWSMYSYKVLNAPNESSGAIALLIFTLSAIAIYIPAGSLSNKIGRKKSVLIGVSFIFVSFVGAFLITLFMTTFNVLPLIILFVFAGIGWALINVNSYPMVVEMANEKNGGQFTGYYYTSSMLAQTLTPLAAGFLMDTFSRVILFPYAFIFLAIAFVFILFTKDDNLSEVKENAEWFNL